MTLREWIDFMGPPDIVLEKETCWPVEPELIYWVFECLFLIIFKQNLIKNRVLRPDPQQLELLQISIACLPSRSHVRLLQLHKYFIDIFHQAALYLLLLIKLSSNLQAKLIHSHPSILVLVQAQQICKRLCFEIQNLVHMDPMTQLQALYLILIYLRNPEVYCAKFWVKFWIRTSKILLWAPLANFIAWLVSICIRFSLSNLLSSKSSRFLV